MTRRTYPGARVLSLPESTYFDRLIRVEKYRPETLDDVVSHKDITGTSEYRRTGAYMSI